MTAYSATPSETDGTWTLAGPGASVIVNPRRGADILSLVHRESGREILWRHPRWIAEAPPTQPLDSAPEAFYDFYPGGIQEIFPQAGPGVPFNGTPMIFHGDASRVPWTAVAEVNDQSVSLACSTILSRYPFALRRIISIDGTADLRIRAEIENLADVPMPVHWGFHPAFSEELTQAPAFLQGPLASMTAHDGQIAGRQDYGFGERLDLPVSEGLGTLALKPADAGSADILYGDVDDGWVRLVSPAVGLQVTMRWPVEVFPSLWLWQECRDPSGYPWWGLYHVVGIEPSSATPMQSLEQDVASGSALWVEPAGSVSAEIVFEIEATE